MALEEEKKSWEESAEKARRNHRTIPAFLPGDPRINRTIPGPGRPRSEVKARLGVEREKNIQYLCEVRDNVQERTRDRLEAVVTMLAYDIGKPAQIIEGEGEQLIVTVRTVSGADPFVVPQKTN